MNYLMPGLSAVAQHAKYDTAYTTQLTEHDTQPGLHRSSNAYLSEQLCCCGRVPLELSVVPRGREWLPLPAGGLQLQGGVLAQLISHSYHPGGAGIKQYTGCILPYMKFGYTPQQQDDMKLFDGH
jgi:hypothetical protein